MILSREAVSNYSRLYFTSMEKMLLTKVLQWCQSRLPEDIFVRVHNKHLVSRNFVKRFYDMDAKTVLLNNCENIMVSRRRKKIVKMVLH